MSKVLGTSTTKSLWYSESSKVFSSSSERLKYGTLWMRVESKWIFSTPVSSCFYMTVPPNILARA
jgi:hypothetical protein